MFCLSPRDDGGRHGFPETLWSFLNLKINSGTKTPFDKPSVGTVSMMQQIVREKISQYHQIISERTLNVSTMPHTNHPPSLHFLRTELGVLEKVEVKLSDIRDSFTVAPSSVFSTKDLHDEM